MKLFLARQCALATSILASVRTGNSVRFMAIFDAVYAHLLCEIGLRFTIDRRMGITASFPGKVALSARLYP